METKKVHAMKPTYNLNGVERIERRKRERNKADWYFEQHRDNCQKCIGRSLHDIRDGKTFCIDGEVLAVDVSVANDVVRSIG